MARGYRGSGSGVQLPWIEGMAGRSRAEGEGCLEQRIQILKHTPPPPPLAQRVHRAAVEGTE